VGTPMIGSEVLDFLRDSNVIIQNV